MITLILVYLAEKGLCGCFSLLFETGLVKLFANGGDEKLLIYSFYFENRKTWRR